MWKNILVPHDFSACASRALRVAADLARVHRAELALLHVSPLPENLPADMVVVPTAEGSPVLLTDYTKRGALRRLEEIAEPLRRDGLAVVTKAVTGDIADEVLAAAEDLAADVLVVGTHGRRGFSHLVLGSIAEKLVRRAAVPVVTVRSMSPEAEPTAEERDAEDELAG